MPKMKSVRGAQKRIRRRASGSLKRGKAFRRHLLTSKNRDRKRRLGKRGAVVHETNVLAVNRMMPK